ncbi:amidohydrolase [Chlorella sorokiniana]|uniref:Amidohydrolase n=1 Tax=Chlorella sorokiniana TaxID=3076 RepID=A0A2P6TB26_CHLSO|nr:amidohydrolase [Chlorella sorokiniana]|eukprot:PRW05757.1 amidohydrolase [Chlorella sorokiniana]
MGIGDRVCAQFADGHYTQGRMLKESEQRPKEGHWPAGLERAMVLGVHYAKTEYNMKPDPGVVRRFIT